MDHQQSPSEIRDLLWRAAHGMSADDVLLEGFKSTPGFAELFKVSEVAGKGKVEPTEATVGSYSNDLGPFAPGSPERLVGEGEEVYERREKRKRRMESHQAGRAAALASEPPNPDEVEKGDPDEVERLRAYLAGYREGVLGLTAPAPD
ncbi:MAG: hypothetical protein HOV94_34635 [Saccharothrix sp.]|nr:hypothetical protein [Saccharothrix sp.]